MQTQGFLRKVTSESRQLSTKVLSNVSPDSHPDESLAKLKKPEPSLQEAQEIICCFFLNLVKRGSPESVLQEFNNLFTKAVNIVNFELQQALRKVISANEESDFRDILKRSCYILINNWIAARNYKPTQELILLLSKSTSNLSSSSRNSKVLNRWLTNFINSQDYQELKLFVSKYENRDQAHWKCRYASYLLAPQYVNSKNSEEHRQAARILSKQLQEQFKLELAMYTARARPVAFTDKRIQNPTALGDEALRLVKRIVAKRGSFSYPNLAHIFLNQTQGISYKEFKQSLIKYLIFSVGNEAIVESLKTTLGKKLELIYENHHEEDWTKPLLLKTANRLIGFFTTEKQGEPSPLFMLLASQGNPLTLAILLLKILLICPQARTHLEVCMARLIEYYQDYSQEECHWVINFLEISKIILAIYTENVQYNLVNMENAPLTEQSILDENACRVFSQSRNR